MQNMLVKKYKFLQKTLLILNLKIINEYFLFRFKLILARLFKRIFIQNFFVFITFIKFKIILFEYVVRCLKNVLHLSSLKIKLL